MFSFCKYRGGFWLRVFGYGLAVNDRSQYAPFSVRNGYQRELRIGRYGIKFLNRGQNNA